MTDTPGHHALIEKAIQEQVSNLEHFVARYLAATGARIEDTTLCQQADRETGIIRYWCEPKTFVMDDDISRDCMLYLKHRFEAHQVPPLVLPPDSVIADIVGYILRMARE